MSIISASKKAVMQGDSAKLMQQAYGMKEVYGVPVEVLNPGDIDRYKFGICLMDDDEYIKLKIAPWRFYDERTELFSVIRALVDRAVGQDIPEGKRLDLAKDFTLSKMMDFNHSRKSERANVVFHWSEGHKKNAHHYEQHEYKPPRFAIVQPSQARAFEKDFIGSIFSSLTDPVFRPVASMEHWQFLDTQHEFAHVSGAGEPQSDAMAALIDQKTHEGNIILRHWADVRAVVAVLSAIRGKEDTLEEYGWPTVEVNDYIARLPQDVIDNLSEEDIGDIRFQKFDHMVEHVLEVARRLKQSGGIEIFEHRDFSSMWKVAAQERMYKPFNDEERQILTRFALACMRLPHGAAMYDSDNDEVSLELLDSEQIRPYTFIPGVYIPE